LGSELVARLEVDVLLSHLACADEDHGLNARQLRLWREACARVAHRRASLANSAGIALGADYHGDLTRPGIALYGGVPRGELAGRIGQVVRPMAALLQVRDVPAGETIGYNATFVAPQAMRVGTIALGYADGYLRCWSGKGMLRSDGIALPVLGRVSMDMTAIDLSAAPQLREGDWVEADYTLPDAAAASGLSQYELLTLLGQRFGR
jgi:alanine racemase